MLYCDVHCHLPKEAFSDSLAVLDRAQGAGVKRVIVNGMSLEDNQFVFDIKHPIIRYAFGSHPCDVADDIDALISWIRSHKEDCLAIGEIGLDGHWKPETLPVQREHFEKMLALSVELNVPIIVHSRKAEEEILDLVKDHPTPVILHAFGGNKKLVARAVEQKHYLSLPSNIVRSQNVQLLADLVPLRLLLTETDAPYMSPVKDGHSEPKDVVGTIEKLAEIKGITVEECSNVIFMNYKQVFRD